MSIIPQLKKILSPWFPLKKKKWLSGCSRKICWKHCPCPERTQYLSKMSWPYLCGSTSRIPILSFSRTYNDPTLSMKSGINFPFWHSKYFSSTTFWFSQIYLKPHPIPWICHYHCCPITLRTDAVFLSSWDALSTTFKMFLFLFHEAFPDDCDTDLFSHCL